MIDIHWAPGDEPSRNATATERTLCGVTLLKVIEEHGLFTYTQPSKVTCTACLDMLLDQLVHARSRPEAEYDPRWTPAWYLLADEVWRCMGGIRLTARPESLERLVAAVAHEWRQAIDHQLHEHRFPTVADQPDNFDPPPGFDPSGDDPLSYVVADADTGTDDEDDAELRWVGVTEELEYDQRSGRIRTRRRRRL